MQEQEQTKDQLKSKKPNSPKLTVNNFDDLSLFLINFAEKKYPCTEYIDKPVNAREILTKVAKNELNNVQALKQIVMSKQIPQNDNFVQLYKKPTENSDLVFELRNKEYRCHQFVFNSCSAFLCDAMKKQNEINYKQFG